MKSLTDQSEINFVQTDQLARMLKDRFVCDLIGIKLIEAGIGFAKAELEIRDIHHNGIGIVQGGVLFTIADYAFAAACNYAEDEVVGIETSVSFVKSVKSGKIIAEAQEVSRSNKFACCDVRVLNEKGELLTLFHGRGYLLPKKIKSTKSF
ncbi:MAG: PaaI family thioesterase [Planctomycetia bacterium]|nr:PaaI family thioesterase [Planctomycetia bacterium]